MDLLQKIGRYHRLTERQAKLAQRKEHVTKLLEDDEAEMAALSKEIETAATAEGLTMQQVLDMHKQADLLKAMASKQTLPKPGDVVIGVPTAVLETKGNPIS